MNAFRPKHRLPRGGNACDFCGAADVMSLYRCHNFNWEDVPVFRTATGRWAACGFCSHLIESQNWGLLNRRVMREVSKRHGMAGTVLDELRASLKQLHRLFAEHVVQGEELTVHRSALRRVILTG